MVSRQLVRQMTTVRTWLLKSPGGLTDSELLRTPSGWNNNILWNIGHVITDQCNMIYLPCGLPSPLPAEYNALFDPGTSPAGWHTVPNASKALECASNLQTQIQTDMRGNRFETYSPMKLDDGVVLSNVEEAVSHCNLHEAIHLGVIMALRRAVRASGF